MKKYMITSITELDGVTPKEDNERIEYQSKIDSIFVPQFDFTVGRAAILIDEGNMERAIVTTPLKKIEIRADGLKEETILHTINTIYTLELV